MKHKQLLKMIEGVDQSDTETMDEIDARVWCYIHKQSYYSHVNKADGFRNRVWFGSGEPRNYQYGIPEYTRSRDALKAIRPDGWGICHSPQGKFNTHIIVYCYQIGQKGYNTKGGLVLPTEELAELHAIIQTIAYERLNDD